MVGDRHDLDALTDLSGTWIDRVHASKAAEGIILDMDSSESPTPGEQEGSAWDEPLRLEWIIRCLFVFTQYGDLDAASWERATSIARTGAWCWSR